jgi:hypothetical protein
MLLLGIGERGECCVGVCGEAVRVGQDGARRDLEVERGCRCEHAAACGEQGQQVQEECSHGERVVWLPVLSVLEFGGDGRCRGLEAAGLASIESSGLQIRIILCRFSYNPSIARNKY